MRRCVIVGGAPIGDYGSARSCLRAGDFFLYCDAGLFHREGLGAAPDLIVGDFDSHPRPETEAETIALPREKDDTDTVYAAREAVKRGFEDFLLLGCAGGRVDHTLANLGLLLWLDSLGKRALLADDFSEMEIVSSRPASVTEDWPYFSLLAVDGPAGQIAVTGAKWPLTGAEITAEYAYGVSNEVLPGRIARISVGTGRLLLVRVRKPQADLTLF